MNRHAQEVLKKCLLHEKEGLDFYQEAVRSVARGRTRQAFATLIEEERGHIVRLFERYRGEDIGSVEALLAQEPHIESPLLRELKQALDRDLQDRKALQMAMRLEQANRDEYLRHAAEAADPEVRAVYESLARDEERHFQVVESEYAHLMAMVHETDIDTYVRE
ncbi:MAG TPA: ferritin family protein [Desulfuromonadales bacterium]|jgi:rubrerythrin